MKAEKDAGKIPRSPTGAKVQVQIFKEQGSSKAK